MVDYKFSLNKNIELIVHLEGNSVDEFLGTAEQIKKLQKVVNNINSTIDMVTGQKRTCTKWSEAEDAQLITLCKEGKAPKEIAKIMNRSEITIYNKRTKLRKANKI